MMIVRRVASALALVVLISAAAHAQPRRYTRAPVSVAPPSRDRPPPATSSRPATPDGPIDDDHAGTLLSIQGKVAPLRRAQIELLDGNIADCERDGCEPDEIADYHYRKAELYALEQRFYRLETQRLAIARDAAKTDASRAALAKESAATAKAAKDSLVLAIEVYRALVDDKRFANYANLPKALFFYGYMLGAGGYREAMRDAYDRLLREYPQSPYVPEAHLAFADYHFEAKQLADAESRYRRVLQFPKAQPYWYAKYKLGWVQLDLGSFQDALETFHDVVAGTAKLADRKALHRAAKNDLVRAYAEVGNVHRARDYFKKLDADGWLALDALLADLLREHGKTEKAIYVYRDLIGAAPRDRDVCLWQHHVTNAMLAAGDNAKKIDEIERLVKLYAALAAKRALPAEELAECRDLAKDMATDLARAWHQEWVKTKDVATYALAARAYDAYLRVFPGDADFAEIQYFRAELAWTRADAEVKQPRLAVELWDDAAAEFIAVVDTGQLDAKRQAEAARAAVLAAVNSALADPRAAVELPPVLTAPAAIVKPQPIPERDQKVLAAFERYRRSVTDPASTERIEMAVYHAALLRRWAHHADALPLLADVVDHHRMHPLGEDAANALLDSYNQLHRDDELVAAARRLLRDRAFLAGKEALERRLIAIDVTYARKQAEKLELAGRTSGDRTQLVACGEAYAELYNRDPEAAGAEELLYNAAVCFEDARSVGLALGLYEKVEAMGARAREDVRARAVARLGAAYGRIARYTDAARYLELFAAKYAGAKAADGLPDQAAAWSDAVLYRRGTGDDAAAIADTKRFVASRAATPAARAEAFFNLHAIYDKQGDVDALVAHLRRYVATYGAAGGAARLVEAHARIGLALWTASCPAGVVDGSCVRVTRLRSIDGAGAKRRGRRLVQTQCGAGTRVDVIERDARRVKDAMAAFGKATAAAAALPADAPKTWSALAALYALEPRYEAYLAQAFPTNLDFDPAHASAAKKSMARFERWLATKDATAQQLKQAYQAVIGLGEPANAIAAAARIGQIAQHASEALTTAEVPAFIRPYPEAVERYCDTLGDKTTGLDELTVDAYTVCLDTSTKLGWFSEWSRVCERELGVLLPGRYPATAERRSAPSQRAVPADVEPRAAI
jgi:hypothetical protein